MAGRTIRFAIVLASFGILAPAQVPMYREYRYHPPSLEYQVRPVYPPLAKAARIQGVVRLQVRIGISGRVEQVQLISGHPFLVEAAMNAVRKWRYSPPVVGGRYVAATIQVDVGFTLNEENDGPVTWV